MSRSTVTIIGLGMVLVFWVIVAIIFAPSRAHPEDFPGKGDVYYLWPGRMILPPESTVEELDTSSPDDPAPQCIPANESCEFPEEEE